MTKQEAEDLVATATGYLGQTIIIKSVEYIFTEISRISCVKENEKETCSVYGKLVTEKKKNITLPLSQIVAAFS